MVASGGKSLLPVGVTGASGSFQRGDMVACLNEAGQEVARGLVNYSLDEVRQIKGKASSAIEPTLGYRAEDELIHRDNLVVT